MGMVMKDIEMAVKDFCRENGISVALSYAMPSGYETAYGTYGPYLLGKLTNRCPAVGVSPQPVGN